MHCRKKLTAEDIYGYSKSEKRSHHGFHCCDCFDDKCLIATATGVTDCGYIRINPIEPPYRNEHHGVTYSRDEIVAMMNEKLRMIAAKTRLIITEDEALTLA